MGVYEKKGVENCHRLEPLGTKILPKVLSSQKILLGKWRNGFQSETQCILSCLAQIKKRWHNLGVG